MSEIFLVGTVSNVEKKLESDLAKVLNALSAFKKISIFLVESDSTDHTNELLNKLAITVPNFSFISLGHLKHLIPDRIDRIRYCRNQYVSYIRNIPKNKLPRYTAVADLDGINNALSNKAVNSCFLKNEWDVVLSNQKFGYYDIYALRHEVWQPTDCFTQLEELKCAIQKKHSGKYFNMISLIEKFRLNWEFDRARKVAIYSKMVIIKKSSPWIQVQSGFGGFAIYKSQLFLQHDYSTNITSNKESEHVAFNSKIISTGGKIFINPKLINSYFNTYNVNRYFIVRELRRLLIKHKKISIVLKKFLWKL